MLALMQILALADTPLDKPLEQLLRKRPVDLVLCLGDLGHRELAEAVSLGVPVFGVRGNHDIPGQFEALGIVDLHLARHEFGGLSFGGLEGSPRYKIGEYQYTESEIDEMLYAYERVDVMCCHSPPQGINDDPSDPVHTGFASLRRWVLTQRPRVLLHGHTYPVQQQMSLGQTHIRYVHGAALLKL